MTEPVDLPAAAPPEPPYGVPLEVPEAAPARKGHGPGRRFAEWLGTRIGEVLGAVGLFPLLMATMGTGIWLLLDGEGYEWVFAGTFGVFAFIGAFFLAAGWFGVLFFRYWPLFVLGIGAFIAWKALT